MFKEQNYLKSAEQLISLSSKYFLPILSFQCFFKLNYVLKQQKIGRKSQPCSKKAGEMHLT